ncbi:MAG: PDZ domain-containing protein, partial [Acidobacteriota bacterium]
MTLVAIAGGFSSFQRNRSAFERLDFRFHWENSVIAVDSVDPGSGAAKAGLRPGDRIWVVAGVPASEVNGLKKSLRRTGQAVPLIVNRGHQTLTVIYLAPKLKIDYPYLFLTFTGFLYLSIGLFTVFRRSRGESLLFFFMTLMSFIV